MVLWQLQIDDAIYIFQVPSQISRNFALKCEARFLVNCEGGGSQYDRNFTKLQMQKTHQNRCPRPSKLVGPNTQNLKLFQMGFTIVLESILWSHKGFIFWVRIFRKRHARSLRLVYWRIAISGSKLFLKNASHGWVSCICHVAPERANALNDGTVVFDGTIFFLKPKSCFIFC